MFIIACCCIRCLYCNEWADGPRGKRPSCDSPLSSKHPSPGVPCQSSRLVRPRTWTHPSIHEATAAGPLTRPGGGVRENSIQFDQLSPNSSNSNFSHSLLLTLLFNTPSLCLYRYLAAYSPIRSAFSRLFFSSYFAAAVPIPFAAARTVLSGGRQSFFRASTYVLTFCSVPLSRASLTSTARPYTSCHSSLSTLTRTQCPLHSPMAQSAPRHHPHLDQCTRPADHPASSSSCRPSISRESHWPRAR